MEDANISWDEFTAVDLRVGTIISAEEFPQARKPAYKLKIDFGEDCGIKLSSAQITNLYGLEELVGKQIVAVVNLGEKQIGPLISQCLVTGFYREDGVVLAVPDKELPNGSRLA